jgi:hypothetical protein
MVIIKHPTSRIDSSFRVRDPRRSTGGKKRSSRGRGRGVPREDARCAAEDDVEANERGTNEPGARENPCADFVAPITRARERRRRLARAPGARELASTRFRGEPRSRVFHLRDAVATCANSRTTPRL